MIDIYELRAKLGLDASGAVAGARQATDAFRSLDTINNALAKTAVATGAAIGAASIAIYKLGKLAYSEAARVQELDVSMKAIGVSTGIGHEAILEATAGIRERGIELAASQQIAIQFAQNNLDMAKASKVARVAQDLAVISQRNSTEQTNLLTYAIITGRSQLLKSAGIQKSAGQMYDEYAATIGKTAAGLNAMEKQQAVLNGVLEEGKRVAGTYEAAMMAPGKVLRSFPRLINDMYVELGKSVVVGFGPVIKSAYDMVGAFSKTMRESVSFRRILGALAVVLEYMVQPLLNMTENLEKVFKSIFVGQTAVKNFAVTFMEFLPIIAAVAVGLTTLAGRSILGMIPILRNVAFAFNPVIAVMLALGATSPAVRQEFVNLFNAVKPLLPVILDLAKMIANGLITILQISLPVIRTFVEFIGGTVTAFVNFVKAGGFVVTAIKNLGIGLTILIPLIMAYTKIKALATFITGTGFVTALMAVVNAIRLSVIPYFTALIAYTKVYGITAGLASLGAGKLTFAVLKLRIALKLLLAATVIGAAIVAVGFLADKFILSKLAAEDLEGSLGGLGGGLEDLDKFVADLEAGMSNLEDKFSLDLPAGLTEAAKGLEDFDKSLLDVTNGLGTTGQAVDKVKERLDKLNAVVTSFSEFAENIKDSRPVIQGALEDVGKEFETFSKIISKTKKKNVDELIASFEQLAKVTQEKLGSAIADAKNQLESARTNFKSFQSEVANSIKGILNFGKAAEGADFLGALERQATQAKDFGGKVQKLIKMGLSEAAIQQILQSGFETGGRIADQIIAGGQTVVNQVNKLVASTNQMAESVGYFGAAKFYQAGIDQAQALVDALLTVLDTRKSEIIAWATEVARIIASAVSGVTPTTSTGKPPPKKTFTNPYSARPTTGFGSPQVPVIRTGGQNFTYGSGSFAFSAPGFNIPFPLADGGIVKKPSIALIGEAGPEAVIPLSKLNSSGGVTININAGNVVGSREELLAFIQKGLREYDRRNGKLNINA